MTLSVQTSWKLFPKVPFPCQAFSPIVTTQGTPIRKSIATLPPSLPLSLSTSLSTPDLISIPNVPEKNERIKVIIVGGGPTGLACALLLANAPYFWNVHVYEASVEDGYTSYDPSKSFVYNVNARGQKFTTLFPNLQQKLEQRGVGTLDGIVVVPSDPNVIVPKPVSMSVNTRPTKPNKMSSSSSSSSSSSNDSNIVNSVSYWIPRHDFVQILQETIMEHEECRWKEIQENDRDCSRGEISLTFGKACTQVTSYTTSDHRTMAIVHLKDRRTNELLHDTASLVIGADGMNSMVRESLRKHNPQKFAVKKWKSPATGLRLKSLQLPANFTIPKGDGTLVETNGKTMYAIRSTYNGPRTCLSLGILPNNRMEGYRPANCITRENHEIWSLKEGDSLRSWFEGAFPRMPFKKEDHLIPKEEWDRLAKADGTRFPFCQYSKGLVTTFGDGSSGVALVGDAVHAFPPDIGQGVNAGLGDVLALCHSLKEVCRTSSDKNTTMMHHETHSFRSALLAYEKNRGPEIKALIQLARCGSPFQYRQADYRSRIGKMLWTWNFLLRLVLHKLTLGIFPKQAILLAQDDSLSFRQVMQRANIATGSLLGIMVAFLGVMLLRCTKFSYL